MVNLEGNLIDQLRSQISGVFVRAFPGGLGGEGQPERTALCCRQGA